MAWMAGGREEGGGEPFWNVEGEWERHLAMLETGFRAIVKIYSREQKSAEGFYLYHTVCTRKKGKRMT